MEAQGERIYSSYSFTTLALDAGDWSALRPGPALSPERTHGTRWIGGCVGLRAGLGTEAIGKILCPCQGWNPGRPICTLALYWLSYPRITLYWENKKLSCKLNRNISIYGRMRVLTITFTSQKKTVEGICCITAHSRTHASLSEIWRPQDGKDVDVVVGWHTYTQHWRRRQYASPESWYKPTCPHDIKTQQNTRVFRFVSSVCSESAATNIITLQKIANWSYSVRISSFLL
jgi:hypothetical protein